MRHYDHARSFIGLKEIRGPVDEPKIVEMFAKVGHSWVQDDETAWCAAFVGAVLEDCGIRSTRALNARSYLDWGEPVPMSSARKGDIVVFVRGDPKGWQGHVAFFERLNDRSVDVLGGNQNNKVGIDNYSLKRVLGVRRPPEAIHAKAKFDIVTWLADILGQSSTKRR